ncbi:hypothetical protein ACEPPN_005948 [Leptodophora sp. 'Broadleaf-Isolate-01']
MAAQGNSTYCVVLDASIPKSQLSLTIEDTPVNKKLTLRGTRTKGKSKGRRFSHRKENRKCNEPNRTKEQMEPRDILRENPKDADALAVFANYNPQYEGETIEKGVGVSRNFWSIKVRGRCLVNTDTNVANAGSSFGREVFESDKCSISFNTYKDLREVEGAAEEAGIMPKSLRIRYRDLQSIKL